MFSLIRVRLTENSLGSDRLYEVNVAERDTRRTLRGTSESCQARLPRARDTVTEEEREGEGQREGRGQESQAALLHP